MDAQFFTQSLFYAALKELLDAQHEQQGLVSASKSKAERSSSAASVAPRTSSEKEQSPAPRSQQGRLEAVEASATVNSGTQPLQETGVDMAIEVEASEANSAASIGAIVAAGRGLNTTSNADNLSIAVFSLYTLYHTQPGARIASATARSAERQQPMSAMYPIRVSAETCLKLADVRATLLLKSSEGERHATEALALLAALVHPSQGRAAGSTSSSSRSSRSSSSSSSSSSSGNSSNRNQLSNRSELDYAASAFNVCAFDAPVPKHPSISNCFRPASHLWDAPLKRLISTRRLPPATPATSVASERNRASNENGKAVLSHENALKICQLSRAYSAALQECKKAATSAQEEVRIINCKRRVVLITLASFLLRGNFLNIRSSDASRRETRRAWKRQQQQQHL